MIDTLTVPSELPGTWVTRFAPSPTGYLHLGHVAHAIEVWRLAGELGAKVILRIEDHDRGRCRAEYEAAILEDLAWLGFRWDGPIQRQSEREDRYRAHLTRLRDAGLVYACDCSRRQILARTGASDSGELRYDNHCRERALPLRDGVGWRVCLPDERVAFTDIRLGPQIHYPLEQCGDVLIRDRDSNWTYQFCVVVDDWEQGVNLVVRGEDLLASTGRQILLAELLGRSDMPRFHHHGLLMDEGTGQKLSKRDAAHAIREDRLNGMDASEILKRARQGITP